MARCPPNSHAFRVAGSGKILITQFILIGRAFMAQECLYDSTLGIVLAPHELREFLYTSIQILKGNYKKTFSIDTIRIAKINDNVDVIVGNFVSFRFIMMRTCCGRSAIKKLQIWSRRTPAEHVAHCYISLFSWWQDV